MSLALLLHAKQYRDNREVRRREWRDINKEERMVSIPYIF
jgi:hypothetical protein